MAFITACLQSFVTQLLLGHHFTSNKHCAQLLVGIVIIKENKFISHVIAFIKSIVITRNMFLRVISSICFMNCRMLCDRSAETRKKPRISERMWKEVVTTYLTVLQVSVDK